MDKKDMIAANQKSIEDNILEKIKLIEDEFFRKCCKRNINDNWVFLNHPSAVYCQQIIMEILELLRKVAPIYYDAAIKINSDNLSIDLKVQQIYGVLSALKKSIHKGDFDIIETQSVNKLNLTKKEMTINSQKQQNELDKYNTIYDQLKIHSEIKRVSESLFKSEHYSQAIEAAFKQIILMVKEKADHPRGNNGLELDGRPLMFEVFSKDKPILKLNNLNSDIDKDEQDGFRYLFGGAAQGIRNPKAHSIQDLKDPQKAIEYILFASLLARKIDESKLNKKE